MSELIEKLGVIRNEKENLSVVIKNTLGQNVPAFTRYSEVFQLAGEERNYLSNAVESKIGTLSSELYNLEFCPISVEQLPGKYYNSNGQLCSNTNGSYCIINTRSNTCYKLFTSLGDSSTQPLRICMFDGDMNLLSSIGDYQAPYSYKFFVVSASSECRYIGCSNSSQQVKIRALEQRYTSSKVEFIYDNTSVLTSALYQMEFVDDIYEPELCSNYVIAKNSGSLWNLGRGVCTKPIDVFPGEKLRIYKNFITGLDTIHFYTENATFDDNSTLSSSIISSYEDSSEWSYVTIPAGCKKLVVNANIPPVRIQHFTENCNNTKNTIESVKRYDDILKIDGDRELSVVTGKYISNTGTPTSFGSASITMLSAEEGRTYKFSLDFSLPAFAIAFYNADVSQLAPSTWSSAKLQILTPSSPGIKEELAKTGGFLNYYPIVAPVGTKYIAASTKTSYLDNVGVKETNYQYGSLQNHESRLCALENAYEPKVNSIGNVLFEKAYSSTGDSWTVNIGTRLSYAQLIADRNKMKYHSLGGNGTSMVARLNNDWSYVSDEDFSRKITLSSKYKAISADIMSSDYITFAYGINDTLTEQLYVDDVENPGTQVLSAVSISGSRDDTEISTWWGAYNTVLSAVYQLNPKAKLGMIINESPNIGRDETALLTSIAEWWGIPYINLNGANMPAMMNESKENVNPFVKKIRNRAMCVENDTSHPGEFGNYYRSTIIENFMRSL